MSVVLRRAAPAALLLALAALAGATIQLQSGAMTLGSDQANSALEAAAVARGNVLLHGWFVPPDSFYTSRVLISALLAKLLGFSEVVVRDTFAVDGALLVLAGAWLAARGTEGPARYAAAAVAGTALMVQHLVGASTLLVPAGSDHAATVALLLLALLPLTERPGRAGLAVTAALLAVAIMGDPTAQWVGATAIGLAGASLAIRRGERRLAAGILAADAGAVLAAHAALRLIAAAGGFTRLPTSLSVLGLSGAAANAGLAWSGVLASLGLSGSRSVLDVAAGASVVLLTIVAVLLVGRRWAAGSADVATRALLAGIGLDVAAFVFSNADVDPTLSRYLLPASCFAVVLAGRVAVPWLWTRRLAPVAGAAVALQLAAVATAVPREPPAAAPTAAVQTWLQREGLREGYGDYWSSSVITLATHNRVRVRAVTTQDGAVKPFLWLADRTWYSGARHEARFLVYRTGAPYNLDPDAVVKALGPPARVERVGEFTILVWDRDLRPDVGRWLAQRPDRRRA